jgi:murein DD-endopeptidase MepM/ murein hydrolase activator NlpD
MSAAIRWPVKTILICLICLPLKHLYVTSPFGNRIHPITGSCTFHSGIDLRANHDTVFAVMDGYAAAVSYNDVLGINIHLVHRNVASIYGHLSKVFISRGDSVEAGEPIGIIGATGKTTGEHLHFSVRSGRRWIDPLEFIYQFLIKNKIHE